MRRLLHVPGQMPIPQVRTWQPKFRFLQSVHDSTTPVQEVPKDEEGADTPTVRILLQGLIRLTPKERGQPSGGSALPATLNPARSSSGGLFLDPACPQLRRRTLS